MKILKDNYKNITNNKPLTITIGNFDGVHIGHQALINKVKTFTDTKSALLTFEPHPKKVLREVRFETLMSVDQKIQHLNEYQLDKLFIIDFNQEFSNISKEQFIDFLIKLNVKRIVIGSDFRFGSYASGSVKDLKEHFEVIVLDYILEDHIRVSTSYIKDLIITNKLDLAEKLLNKPYQIEGVVIHGDKVGRTLGIPTANLDVDEYTLPANGVYYVLVHYKNKVYAGALNIGYNPTVNYSVSKRTEVHILDFDDFIYDEKLKLTFVEYIRPELKFDSTKELIETMNNDLNYCRKRFQSEEKR